MHSAARHSPKAWTWIVTGNGRYVQQNYSFLVFGFCQSKTKFMSSVTNGGNMSQFAMNILWTTAYLVWQKSYGTSQVSKILIDSSRTDFQKNTMISSFSVSHHTGFCIGGTWSDWKKMRIFLLYVNCFQVSVSLYDEVHHLSAYLLEQQINALKKEEINKLSKVSKNWTFSLHYLSELFFCLCCFISCQFPNVHTSLWLWHLEQRSWHASETRQNWIWLISGGTSQSLWRPECWISPYFLTFNSVCFNILWFIFHAMHWGAIYSLELPS